MTITRGVQSNMGHGTPLERAPPRGRAQPLGLVYLSVVLQLIKVMARKVPLPESTNSNPFHRSLLRRVRARVRVRVKVRFRIQVTHQTGQMQ